uniref:Uridine 5'-monophosphate synthase n=1 Tax=Clastoptera arizonana TaxID=38151 RepID=A0A1B6DH00_9HEMI
MESKLQDLCGKLFDIGALKFGDFQLKVGARSPVYFDLRVIISFPKVMNTLSDIIWEFSKERNLQCDNICGVPYTALPIASVISVKADVPMVIRRKEVKGYGTKKMIEGVFNKGDKCIIIEDVVTTGSSILETVKDLRSEDLEVTDTIVVVNREQGAESNLTEGGVTMHSLLTLSEILEHLEKLGKIDEDIVERTKAYIQDNQLKSNGEKQIKRDVLEELNKVFEADSVENQN